MRTKLTTINVIFSLEGMNEACDLIGVKSHHGKLGYFIKTG